MKGYTNDSGWFSAQTSWRNGCEYIFIEVKRNDIREFEHVIDELEQMYRNIRKGDIKRELRIADGQVLISYKRKVLTFAKRANYYRIIVKVDVHDNTELVNLIRKFPNYADNPELTDDPNDFE